MPDVTPRFKNAHRRRLTKKQRDRAELAAVIPALEARSLGRCEAGFVLGCTGRGEVRHHIKRRSQGGTNDASNLVFCCENCHHGIHDRPDLARERGLLAPKGNA